MILENQPLGISTPATPSSSSSAHSPSDSLSSSVFLPVSETDVRSDLDRHRCSHQPKLRKTSKCTEDTETMRRACFHTLSVGFPSGRRQGSRLLWNPYLVRGLFISTPAAIVQSHYCSHRGCGPSEKGTSKCLLYKRSSPPSHQNNLFCHAVLWHSILSVSSLKAGRT